MNRTVLNGALLGSGGNSNRSFVAILAYAHSVVSAEAMAMRMAMADVTARATAIASSSAIYQAAAQLVAHCASAVNPYIAGLKIAAAELTSRAEALLAVNVRYLVSAGTSAQSTLSGALEAAQATYASSAAVARAVGSCFGIVSKFIELSVSAHALTDATALRGAWSASVLKARALLSNKDLSEDTPDSPDRLMYLPEESRVMEVPE